MIYIDPFAQTSFDFKLNPTIEDDRESEKQDQGLPSNLGNEVGGFFFVILAGIILSYSTFGILQIAHKEFRFEIKPTFIHDE